MTEVELLSGLPGLAFAFSLVLARTSVVVMLVPGLGETELPAMVRAGLALALTLLLLPGIAPRVHEAADPGTGLTMVAAELLTGAALGWLARLPAVALTMSGTVVSYMLGLSSVVQTDPALGGQSAALGRLFGLAAPVLILVTGLYALPLQALASSYQLVAPGGVLPVGGLVEFVTQAMGASFALAVRLSAPFIVASVLWQAALGLLARLIPQLQVYNVAGPGQIAGGIVLLGILAASVLGSWTEGMFTAWAALPGL